MTDLFGYDDIVGLDVTHPRRQRLHEQLAGVALDKPRLPSGLAIYAMLPPPERATHLRSRMADVIARAVSAHGAVTRDDLLGAGFTSAEIVEHFTDACRAARVARMAV